MDDKKLKSRKRQNSYWLEERNGKKTGANVHEDNFAGKLLLKND